ncbi:hypothetical protein B0H16DRAFT_1469252 [Mycena metata]|uniref:Uncharacterized protein n=1 Tax=Mycena metata TaxID=1033252 RepID=A0AAD7MTG1_9AGAR|nr:hypothetical protein B0H16DRAFT_1469252 [Mycena metata]
MAVWNQVSISTSFKPFNVVEGPFPSTLGYGTQGWRNYGGLNAGLSTLTRVLFAHVIMSNLPPYQIFDLSSMNLTWLENPSRRSADTSTATHRTSIRKNTPGLN